MAVSVVVQTGAGVDAANAYLSVADWKLYADQQGWDYTTKSYTIDQIGSAIIRGRAWLDATYRPRWPGSRTGGREQSTAWPRADVIDGDGEEIDDDDIPQEVIDASAEAAWRELQSPGSLAPDLERGGAIKSLKAGSVEVVYADSASLTTVFSGIDAMLDNLLLTAPGGTTVSYPMRA